MFNPTMMKTLCAASLAISATAGAASAQFMSAGAARSPAGYNRTQSYNPNEGLQPNGCVKLCPLDTNPCDPPEYKRADGRCTQKD